MPLGCIDCQTSTKEVKTLRFWRDLFSEFSASFLLIFVANACASLVTDEQVVPLMMQALNNGIAVFTYIEAMGHFSGAHMNPAVSLLFVLTKQLSLLKGIAYTVIQCAGAAAGAGMVYLILNDGGRSRMRPITVADEIMPWQGLLCEVFITYSMTTVILGSIDAKRKSTHVANLAMGLAVGVGIMAGGKITGGAMNPIIPFGPAVVTGIWDDQWIYWLGPFCGACLSALQYNLFTYVERVERSQQCQDKAQKNGGASNDTKDCMPLMVTREKEAEAMVSEA